MTPRDTTPRQRLAEAVRSFAPGGKLRAEHIPPFDALADVLGLPRDNEVQPMLGKLSEQFESCLLYTSPSPRDRG